MPLCRPATQCCCGCSVAFGTKAILILNLVANIFFNISAAFTLVFHIQGLAYSTNQTVLLGAAGFGLAGIPIILLALWCVINKVETPLRLYLCYMILSFLIDMFFAIENLVYMSTCQEFMSVFAKSNRAFACGLSRALNAFMLISLISIQMYLMHVVASHCEDLAHGATAELSDLTHPRDVTAQMKQLQYGALNPLGGDPYGRIFASDSNGSIPLFGKRYHDLSFPPKMQLLSLSRY